jgi:hypothetical protein
MRFWKRQLGREQLHIDIVDYPGEWLLDLPLLRLNYREWSRAAIKQSSTPDRKKAAKHWHASLGLIDPKDPANEGVAERLIFAKCAPIHIRSRRFRLDDFSCQAILLALRH